MCEVKISMFQLCRQVGMLIAIAYVSNYRSMSDLKCKQIHLKVMQFSKLSLRFCNTSAACNLEQK